MKSQRIILVSLLAVAAVVLKAEVTVTTLKTDYKTNPMGMDNPVPRSSWILQSDQMNSMQESFEIRTALNLKDLQKGRNLLWKSNEMASSKSIHVEYGGPPLQSFQRTLPTWNKR